MFNPVKLFYLGLLFALFGFAANTHAIDFELGAGLSRTIVRASDNETQENTAVIASATSLVPYFALTGEEYYPLENIDMGISWQFWGSSYKVNKQEIEEVDGSSSFQRIGTELTGIYFYGLPIVYYRWGDKGLETAKNYRISLGFGYGISYVTMQGKVRMTGLEKTKSVDERPLEHLDAKQLFYSVGIFFRGEYDKYFLQVATYTPQVTSGDFVYRISSVSWVIGRKVSIDFDFDFF